jgi:excisionase family DNA binding protein
MGKSLCLGIKEAAAMLAISPWTVRTYIRRGKLHAVRIGRRVLLEPAELERLVEQGRVGAENRELQNY